MNAPKVTDIFFTVATTDTDGKIRRESEIARRIAAVAAMVKADMELDQRIVSRPELTGRK